MQEAYITASKLACLRGERLLFRGVSFTLGSGDALQVAGPNGIGKSSLIRILAGLALPFTGSVERSGTVGLLDERLALDEHQLLGKALAFWAALDGGNPQDHADRLGLNDLLDVPVRYLSTGQRKRAALARLMGQQADSWLLDEPLNGLDVAGVALVEQLVAEKRSLGGAVVVASHQTVALPGAQIIDIRDHRE